MEIVYSPTAIGDLQHLYKYIVDNWGENVAKRVLKQIASNIRSLEQFPVSGIALGNVIDTPTDYQYLYTEKNYVFYRLELNKVRIIRILNERQKFIDHLFKAITDDNGNFEKE